ncbi:hypothetical protein Tco_0922415 [Tanacetum coccineum]|uniref:Uncharacterized protein n=1 Tax=Tanacetum coccineum TaxID=301880 RepID=A0ABQ5D1C1_9ASTR
MLLEAQSKAIKQENVLAERLHGLDQQMERKGDETLLRWMIYLVVLADTAECVRDAIGFEYCLASSSGWTKSPVLWAEIGESSLTGLELVQETTDKGVFGCQPPPKGCVGFMEAATWLRLVLKTPKRYGTNALSKFSPDTELVLYPLQDKLTSGDKSLDLFAFKLSCLFFNVFGSAWFCMILPGYSSALQIADVFGCALHVCFTDCRCVWLPGYMSALQIADIADVFGSGSAYRIDDYLPSTGV